MNPDTGLPPASVTETTNGSNAVPVVRDWLFPDTTASLAACEEVAVAVKVTGEPVRAAAFAVTSAMPAELPSVSFAAARPEASVVAVEGESSPAPLAIANATWTPETGLSWASFTDTTNGAGS